MEKYGLTEDDIKFESLYRYSFRLLEEYDYKIGSYSVTESKKQISENRQQFIRRLHHSYTKIEAFATVKKEKTRHKKSL